MNREVTTKSPKGSFRFCLGTLVIGSVGLAISTFIEPSVGTIVLAMLFLVTALPTAVWADFALASFSKRRVQLSLRQMFLLVTCLAVFVSMLRDPWPFRLRFAVSQAALERLATRAERGETLANPEWAGLFLIRKIGSKERGGTAVTVLWAQPGGGKPTGFVHRPPTDRGRFNDWAVGLQHNDEWQFFH